MGVSVDKDFRVKRKSSEAGSKSAFAHKVKKGRIINEMCRNALTVKVPVKKSS